jgi:hypothetical protein
MRDGNRQFAFSGLLVFMNSLPSVVKQDTVADNYFYFFRANDGYDASRILNDPIHFECQQVLIHPDAGRKSPIRLQRPACIHEESHQGDGVIQSPLSSFSCETGYGCGQLFLFFQGE